MNRPTPSGPPSSRVPSRLFVPCLSHVPRRQHFASRAPVVEKEARRNESPQELLARHTFPKPTALPSSLARSTIRRRSRRLRPRIRNDGKPSAWETRRGKDFLIDPANPSRLFPGGISSIAVRCPLRSKCSRVPCPVPTLVPCPVPTLSPEMVRSSILLRRPFGGAVPGPRSDASPRRSGT
jgi:hypothetical protein